MKYLFTISPKSQINFMSHNQLPQQGKMMLRLSATIFFVCSYLAGMSQGVTGWQLTGNRGVSAVSFVGTTDGAPLRFGTKNTVKMLLDSVGRLGVGTQTPAYTLDVTGQFRLTNGTQGAGKVLTSDANGVASWLTPASNPWATSGNNLYNINIGNIGIGTVSPGALLDVNGDILVNGLRIGRGTSLFNTIVGNMAMPANTTGINNTAVGYSAMNANTTGSNNTGLGAYTLSKNTTGFENTAVGNEALELNTTGRFNTATGHFALNSNTTGGRNSAFGDSALFGNTGGSLNTALGTGTLIRNTNGQSNTAVGLRALEFIKSGTNNTAIGSLAGTIGKDSAILTNATAIGANAKVATNNSLVLGNNANVGIGTSSPTAKLDIVGAIKIADGTQANNRVLTSDANGLAKWKVAPSAHWLANGNDIYNYNYATGGNVAIGTNSSPYAKLEVNNTMKFTNSSTDVNDGVMGTAPYVPGLNIVGINTDNTARKISFWGGLQQQENITGNYLVGNTNFPNGIWDEYGRLGIGTTAPLEALDINGNLNFSNSTLPVNIINEVGGTDPVMNLGVNFRGSNVNQAYRGGAYRIDSRDGAALHNWYARLPNSASEDVVMALRENGGLSVGSTFSAYSAPDNGALIQGNVGIGKTGPGWKLDVAGDIMADGGWMRVKGNNGLYFESWGGGFYMNDNTWIRTHNDKNIWTGSGLLGSAGGLTVGYGGTAPGYGGAIIAGSVGIGTSSPGNTLDVNGGATVRGYGQIKGGAIINGGYITLCNSLDNSQGNIGIGGGAYNNVKVNINSNQTWGLLVESGAAGKPGGGSWSGVSDKRLKKDIKTYSDGLTALLKIKPVTYHYNELSGFNVDKEYVGVIAQELQEIAPYMVSSGEYKNTGKEFLSVDNSAMTYMLINAVKELKGQADTKDATITKQQEQITDLQAQMKMVLSRLDALQTTQEACCNMAPKTIVSEQPISLTTASLDQNIPNPPVNHATKIGYNIPKGARKSEIVITDNYGKKLKAISLNVTGKGSMNIDTRGLTPGTYSYTLFVDGKMIDTKQMVVGSN